LGDLMSLPCDFATFIRGCGLFCNKFFVNILGMDLKT
jgi:hypothetical protein